jgi:ubiquinone/menaquinone biosynthesis C-methylase UbiE
LKYVGKKADEAVIHLRKEDKDFDPEILVNYSAESADLVIADCVLFQVTDKQKIWREIYRVLKKGGRFIVSDLYSSDLIQPATDKSPINRQEYINLLEKAGFSTLTIFEESPIERREEGVVATWILSGEKPLSICEWCI